MTKLIKYHTNTKDLALFETDNKYWIGSFFPLATHQNGEPAYIMIEGLFNTELEGLQKLQLMTGEEF